MKKKQQVELPEKVRCCDCRHFSRDTCGRSFHLDSGEYFMGTCAKGHADGTKKVFADKPRVCKDMTK